jgi:hypothetical protein
VESCLEYNVHFLHDPHADAYAEMLANMRHHQALVPRYNRRNELTATGPVETQGRRRALDRAAEDMRTRRPAQRVDPRNMHHLAMPHGDNTSRDRAPTPPPEMIEAEEIPHDQAMDEEYDEWTIDQDEMEAAWCHHY